MKGYLLCEDNLYFPEESGNILFAILYDYRTVPELNLFVKNIKDNVPGTSTLDWMFSCGRDVLRIKSIEAHQIQHVIQYCLDHGHRLYMNDSSQVTLNPPLKYTWESREQALLKNYKENITILGEESLSRLTSWEWKITSRVRLPELKEFIREHFKEENDDYFKDILNPKEEFPPSFPLKKPKVEEEEEEELCVICQVNPPNTFVLPCEHIVVCSECSDKLSQESTNINIREHCVMCRTRIEKIHVLK